MILSWYLALPVSCYQQSLTAIWTRVWQAPTPAPTLVSLLTARLCAPLRMHTAWFLSNSEKKEVMLSLYTESNILPYSFPNSGEFSNFAYCMYVCMYVHPYSRFNTGQQHAVVCFRESLVKEFYPCLAVDAYVHGCVDLVVL